MTEFTDRTILVTGAGGGIGGATVRHLVAAGATVLAAGRTADSVAAIADETGAEPVVFDLESEDEIRSAIEGRDLYGVVNCGGWGGEIATPMETDIDVFDKVMSIHAPGSLLVTQNASPAGITRGKGGAIGNGSRQARTLCLTCHLQRHA